MSDPSVQLRLESLHKTFRRANGQKVSAVNNVSIDVAAGELVVLLGPSGCGKTTLLRCVAGLEQPDTGTITIGGTDVFNSRRKVEVPPERRRIGMVFQSYALWPHMTVAENIAYPLKMRGTGRAEIEDRVKRILDMVRIPDLSGQYTGQISGGQQQRVALARALVCGDDLILFDEPLSNVDAKVREHLRLELLSMQRELGFTALYVTHDQEEAMGLATRIAVVADGQVAQLGTPQDIYFRPASLSVARFIGSANQFDGKIVSRDGKVHVETQIGTLNLPPEAAAHATTDIVSVISRPERWEVSNEEHKGRPNWRGKIRASAFLGSHSEYLIDLPAQQIQAWHNDSVLLPVGTEVWCSAPPDAFVVVDRGSNQ